MKSKKLTIALLSMLFLISATPVLASTSVSNIVNVESDTGGNTYNGQTTTKTSTSHTSITTTTNGQTTHVESNESGNIHVETKDGKTTVQTSPGMKVNVTQGEADVKDDLPTPLVHSTPSAREINSSISAKINQESIEVHQNIIARIKNILKRILAIFHL